MKRILGYLPLGGAHVGAAAVIVMTGLIAVEVIGRDLFGFSTRIADEMAGYLLVAIVFMGMAYCLKSKGHIYAEFIVDRANRTVRDFLRLLAYLLAVVYTSMVAYTSYNVMIESYGMGARSFAQSQTPIFLPQMIVPIGMGLFTLQLIIEAIQTARAVIRPKVKRN